MPLKSGSSDTTVSVNIAELMRAYERTGRIGNTRPKNKAHARPIATAIALDKARERAKNEEHTRARRKKP